MKRIVTLTLLLIFIPLCVLFASQETLENKLNSLIPSYLSYMDERAGKITCSILSLEQEEVSWSDMPLVSSDILFTFNEMSIQKSIMFLLHENEVVEDVYTKETEALLAEVGRYFFPLTDSQLVLRYDRGAPLFTKSDDPDLARPGDLLAVKDSSQTLLALLRVDSTAKQTRFLSVEWAQRELADTMPLTPYENHEFTMHVSASLDSLSLNPSYRWNLIPSSYASFHTGLLASFDSTGQILISPTVGVTGEVLMSQLFPSWTHSAWYSRFSVRGSIDAGVGVLISTSVHPALVSELSGEIGYRFSPSLVSGIGVAYRVSKDLSDDVSYISTPSIGLIFGVRL